MIRTAELRHERRRQEDARDRLTWKGLPAFIVEEAGLVRRPGGAVAIPYRAADGALWKTRHVAPSGRRWWSSDGRPLIPFGLEARWPERVRRFRTIVVTEGESDCLALRAYHGGDVDCLAAPGASTWQPEWAGYLAGYRQVLVVGDGDASGKRFAWQVARTVRDAIVVPLPDGEDVRSLLQQHPGTLEDTINHAIALRRFELEHDLRPKLDTTKEMTSS